TRCMAGTPTYGYACGKLAQRVPEGEPMLDVRRREFISLLGGAAAAWPIAARAQQGERIRRVAILLPAAAGDSAFQTRVGAFLQGLQQLGWFNGDNVSIDTRWATAHAAEIRRHAEELAALAPDVILAH